MAGIKGRSGPPGNQNAFRHGLAGITQRRANGTLNHEEQTIREEILVGLIDDKGGENQIGTAERILAEIISSDVALLVTLNQAIDGVLKQNHKARENPKALAQLDGYKRGLVNSLTGNLQRFGFGRAAKVQSLQEIIAEMSDDDKTSENTSPDGSITTVNEQSQTGTVPKLDA